MDAASLIHFGILASMVLLVMALGMHTTLSEALCLFRRPFLMIRSLVAMNVAMPLLVIWLVASFDLLPAVKIALVALAVSPVPPFLPGKQLKLAESGAYTVGLFFAAALLSIVLVPATMAIVEALGIGGHHVSALSVLRIVAITVLVPLLVGIVLRALWPALAARAHPIVNRIAMGLLLVAMIPVVVAQWPAVRSLIGDGTLIAIAVATILGLAVGHVLGGPRPEDRSVLALATAARHPAVAIAIAAASFPEQKLVSAAVLLSLVVGSLASIPYVAWRRKSLRLPQRPIVGA
jgi:bile acid:Na+ symporter, BASS family